MSEPNGIVGLRLQNLERRLDHLYDLKPDVIAAKVADLHDDITDLSDELKGVRRALWGFGLSVAGGAILFAFTALQVWSGG
jgi:hypothetical protein